MRHLQTLAAGFGGSLEFDTKDYDLSTAEGRRAAGKVYVQAHGAAAAMAACDATIVAAGASYYCGLVGSEVAGRLYDYTEKYVEGGAEDAYNWSRDAASDAWASSRDFVVGGAGSLTKYLPCFDPRGCDDEPLVQPPHFFSDKSYFAALPPAADILKGAPSFRASAALKTLPRNPSVDQLMATELGPPVAKMMRNIMDSWNGFLSTQVGVNGMSERDVRDRFYGNAFGGVPIEDVVSGRSENPNTDWFHPYRFDGGDFDMRAGTVRNALASYVLLGMIAEQAQQDTGKSKWVLKNAGLLNLPDQEKAWDEHKYQEWYTQHQADTKKSSWGPWLLFLAGAAVVGGVAVGIKRQRSNKSTNKSAAKSKK